MKKILSLTALGIVLGATTHTANAETYYKDWDYFRGEVRQGYRGVADDKEDDLAQDFRNGCLYINHIKKPTVRERLRAIRQKDPCNEPGDRVLDLGEIPQVPVAPVPKKRTTHLVPDDIAERSIRKLEGYPKIAPTPRRAAPAVTAATIKPIKDSKIVFFDFNSAALTETTKIRLKSIIAALKRASKVDSVKIAGHADQVGAASKNSSLSVRRANAVRDYLARTGKIKSNVVDLKGLGESVSVTNCPKSLPKAQRVSCLQADRRVEIIIEGYER